MERVRDLEGVGSPYGRLFEHLRSEGELNPRETLRVPLELESLSDAPRLGSACARAGRR